MDDAVEIDWVYASELQPRTLLLFGGQMGPYERRFMRITVEQNIATLQLFLSDDPSEQAVTYLDLGEISMVRNIVLPQKEARSSSPMTRQILLTKYARPSMVTLD